MLNNSTMDRASAPVLGNHPGSDYSRLLPSAADWALLTTTDLKAARYVTDSHFRLGWYEWQDHEVASTDLLWQTTALVLKPEALAGHRAGAILERTAALGFEPVQATAVPFGEVPVHATWQYTMDRASDDWIRLRSCYCLRTPALYVALRHSGASRSSPATLRLSEAKGSAHLDRQRPTDLRANLGAPNPVISFLHAPDDAADFLRELTIWLRADNRRAMRDTLVTGSQVSWNELQETVQSMQMQTRKETFDPDGAQQALTRLVKGRASVDVAAANELLHLLEASQKNSFRLSRFELLLNRLGIDAVESWDAFTVASQRIQLHATPLHSLL